MFSSLSVELEVDSSTLTVGNGRSPSLSMDALGRFTVVFENNGDLFVHTKTTSFTGQTAHKFDTGFSMN